ncbi:MAG: hypothetical protein ACOC43_07590 [Desulfohalobiaceae bacterium]
MSATECKDMPEDCPGLSKALHRASRCCLLLEVRNPCLFRGIQGFSGADPPIAEILQQEVLL